MELIIHIVAILTVVQSTWSTSQTSAAPPIGSQNPAHIKSSTTQAPEIRTEFPVSSPSQRTSSNVYYSTGSTPSLLVEATKAHSEQNFTKSSSSEGLGPTTNSPTRTSASPLAVSVSSRYETRTTIERTNLSNESRSSPSNSSQVFVTPSSETSIPTRVLANNVFTEEVPHTTPEELFETPVPGETGLRSSPRVASATTGIDIATDLATPVEFLLTTLGDFDILPDTDLMDTQLPDATHADLTTTGQILTTNPLYMSMTSVKSETMEPVDSLVTNLPVVTDLPTELMTTDVAQTLQTSLPSVQSTAFPTNKQDLELSTIYDGGTDGTPSAFDLISLEATTPLDEMLFDTTEVGTVPTTTSSPLELGSIGTAHETVTDLGMTEANPATDLQEMETDLITEEEGEGTPPLELWTLETSSEEVTAFKGTDGFSTEGYDFLTSPDPVTTIEKPVIPAPCLCEVESAQLSASVCLCNSSLALSNYTYHAHLVRDNRDNMTHPEIQIHSALLSSGSGCWNVSVPLGGYYRLVVTAEDGLGNIASTPTRYFHSGLMPPYLSVEKIPGAVPSLELFWKFPYPTYVDYVTVYESRDNAPATQVTWMRVGEVRTSGRFTYVTSGRGSLYSVAVMIESGGDSVTSNYAYEVIAPPHPEHVRIARITPELLTVQWPYDTSSCRGSCSYLVRYKQASPYNTHPVELPIRCPSLLPAQPARSTSPNPLNGCTADLRDLIPGALYNIDVYASSYDVLSETPAQLRRRTLPTPPENVTVTNVTEQSITISWTPGAGYRTRYRLHAFAPSYSEEVGEVRGDVTDFTFHNLLAGTRYMITIRASSNSTDGEMVLVGETTAPKKPGPVDRLRLEPQIDHRQIRLAFLSPMWPNGVLEGYQVEFVGKRDGSRICNSGQKYLPVVQTSVIIGGLKGGCNYTFTVKARNEVGLGPGVSDSVLTPTGIPLVPEVTPPPPPKSTVKSTNFVVNFDPSVFDDVNGEITHVIVIVAESTAADEPGRSNSSLPRMRTWAEAISNDVIPPYQTSEPLVLSNLARDARRKRSVADTTPSTAPATPTKIEIGTEECSYDNMDVYCNGPLIHGRSYVYRFRGVSPGGYADTQNSLPVALPMSPHGVIIGISTALFSLLVIVIILSIVVIVRKFRLDGRGRYLPANMKDVELTRVANNSHHTISKQKYSRPVRLNDFTRDWFSMNADSNYGYSQEYEAIRKVGRKMTTNTAVSPANVGKNRYTNILPYDRTRVKLSPVDDEEGSDYINANYIPGFSSPREYIACQGPLPGTSDDMWRMIWEQNVTTIVMVTQLVEKGKVKCDQYWPDDHMPVLYGDIQVTMNQTIEENDWNIKEFAVQMRDQRRYVRHWNFLSWPDHGVPESSQALLGFIRRIRSTKPPSTAPMAVHCSAGVGRTGTFIVLDHLLQHMEQYDFVDVMGVVCGMRMHRNFMVQTEQQYVFIHRCLMDVIEERGLAPVPLMSGSLP